MRERCVLVTGASTGIGRACALHLAALGWHVFAGVRKESDGDDLVSAAPAGLTPVHLDVTDEDSIAEAARRVASAIGEEGLDGLLNNAGVSFQGPLEHLPLQDLRRQLEVNVVGQIAVTQAFLPALRRARGRIVLMSSISGLRPVPFLGPYSASKAALESLGDALRVELGPWGIKVVLIEPGSIATPIWAKGVNGVDDIIDRLPPEGRRHYETTLRRLSTLALRTGMRGIAPEKVAVKVAKALTSRRPRARYLVGSDAILRTRVESLLPTSLKDKLFALGLGHTGEAQRSRS
ncbi:SDR family oxidoreductase [soil metagenome]